MTQTAGILTTTGTDSIQFDDTQYIDWSVLDDDLDENNEVRHLFEVGNGTDATVLQLTHEQLLALQQRLTAHLLSTR